jgi:hypothetical protein
MICQAKLVKPSCTGLQTFSTLFSTVKTGNGFAQHKQTIQNARRDWCVLRWS